MTFDLSSVLANIGICSGIVVVVYWFLQHNAEQSKLNRDAMKEVVSRVESIEKSSQETMKEISARNEVMVGDFRKETRTTTDQLVSLNRETVGAMSAVGQRVDGLGREVVNLGSQVTNLTSQVTTLGGSVEKLAEQVHNHSKDPSNSTK